MDELEMVDVDFDLPKDADEMLARLVELKKEMDDIVHRLQSYKPLKIRVNLRRTKE